jgi:hypothetical protein
MVLRLEWAAQLQLQHRWRRRDSMPVRGRLCLRVCLFLFALAGRFDPNSTNMLIPAAGTRAAPPGCTG